MLKPVTGSEAVPSIDAPPPAPEGEGGEVVALPAPAKPKTVIGQVIAHLIARGAFHLLEDEEDLVVPGGHLVLPHDDGGPPTLTLHPADYAVWKSRLDAAFAEKKVAEIRQLRALRVGLKFRDNYARYEVVRLFPDEVRVRVVLLDEEGKNKGAHFFHTYRRSAIEATLAHPLCVIESAAEQQPAPPEA